MKSPLLAAAAVALLALTACQSKTTTTTTAGNSTTENTVAVTPIALPPAIKSEGSFRCHGDNSLVKVTFFEGDASASVQSPPDGAPVMLKAPEAGQPMVADGGWSLSGNDKSFKLTQPGKPEQSCSK